MLKLVLKTNSNGHEYTLVECPASGCDFSMSIHKLGNHLRYRHERMKLDPSWDWAAVGLAAAGATHEELRKYLDGSA